MDQTGRNALLPEALDGIAPLAGDLAARKTHPTESSTCSSPFIGKKDAYEAIVEAGSHRQDAPSPS
jgi:hypothetical protein